MNREIHGLDSPHCQAAPADCFVFDDVVIPATQCRGNAVLRWMWNSAEGTEVYANCLDLNVINADGTGGDPNGGDSKGDDEGAGKGGNPGGNNGGVNDADGGGGQAAGGGNGTSGAMIGGIIAGLACGLFAVLCIYRHRNRKQPGSNQRK